MLRKNNRPAQSTVLPRERMELFKATDAFGRSAWMARYVGEYGEAIRQETGFDTYPVPYSSSLSGEEVRERMLADRAKRRADIGSWPKMEIVILGQD